jgi:hypothetical protein
MGSNEFVHIENKPFLNRGWQPLYLQWRSDAEWIATFGIKALFISSLNIVESNFPICIFYSNNISINIGWRYNGDRTMMGSPSGT